MDTRHAVGCKALRGGVPCTCWLDEKTITLKEWMDQECAKYPGLKERVAVEVSKMEAEMLRTGGCWPSKDAHEPHEDRPEEGGESG
jgi:hypothetical protein